VEAPAAEAPAAEAPAAEAPAAEMPPPPQAPPTASAPAAEAPRKSTAPGKYAPVVYHHGRECSSQAENLGKIETAEKCDKLVATLPDCGSHFMFSREHPDWECRCCTSDGADAGPKSPFWDVYKLQTPHHEPVEHGHGYTEVIHARGQECDEQGLNLGHIHTVRECDEMVAISPECGLHFMFSKAHPDWACRCCTGVGADDGPASPLWSVYKLQTPRPKSLPPIPTLPPVTDPMAGLPVADVPRPSWLIKEDAVVVDARDPPGRGGIVILQPVLTDSRSEWGKRTGLRPRWLRAILATNRAHARRHGLAVVVRAQPTQPQLTPWMVRQCRKKSTAACVRQNERENFNWEKHLMMSEYLLSPQNFTHILMLDADAALVHPTRDTLRGIARTLDEKGRDLFLTDEDWLEDGAGRINGGLMFAKNTNFTRALFQDTFHAHVLGPSRLQKWKIGVPDLECSSNEQICLNDLWRGAGKHHFAPHAMMASGKKFNRGAERGGVDHINDDEVELMHWMGGAKGSAGGAICGGYGRDLTGDGRSGYGCKE